MQKPGLFGMNGFLVFLLILTSLAAHSQQQGYLILLEAENKQAFTVRIGDQLFASSGHGHLVLPQLKDSAYKLNLSFAKKAAQEFVFPVLVHQKDLGFQIKQLDSVWVLYNWQSRETIRPLKEKDSSRILDQGVKREDGFSRLMAAVVNDSSVMYNSYSGRGAEIQAGHTAVKTPDSSSAVGNQPPPQAVVTAKPRVIAAPVPDKKAIRDSMLIIKKSRDSLLNVRKAITRDSLLTVKKTRDSLIYVQRLARKDSIIAAKKALATVDSLLAVKKTAPPKPSVTPAVAPAILPPAAGVVTVTPAAGRTHPNTTVKKVREISLKISRKLVFLDMASDGKADTITIFIYFENADSAKKAIALITPEKKSVNPDSLAAAALVARNKLAQKASVSGCGQLATDGDVEFLRSGILKANSEDDKIKLAGMAFGMKCFTVGQVRLLAGLFVSDKARYRLMDAVHNHIADPEHFVELVNMFTDKNFQRKFLAIAARQP